MQTTVSDQQASGGARDHAGDEKGAAVRFPPPAIFVLLIFAGAGLDYLWPLPLGVPDSFEPVGIAITLFGVAVAILVNGTFKRVGTAIEPWKPTTRLIITGFYRWSRNPIYVGFLSVQHRYRNLFRQPLDSTDLHPRCRPGVLHRDCKRRGLPGTEVWPGVSGLQGKGKALDLNCLEFAVTSNS